MREDLIERLREYAQADDLHKDERDTLIAAAVALEAAREDAADAERYRWMADNAESLPYPDMWRDKEWLDAAIDQARGKENGNG